MLTNCAHSSFALCNLGAVDIRRDSDRLATWVVPLRNAENDMVLVSGLMIFNEVTLLKRKHKSSKPVEGEGRRNFTCWLPRSLFPAASSLSKMIGPADSHQREI